MLVKIDKLFPWWKKKLNIAVVKTCAASCGIKIFSNEITFHIKERLKNNQTRAAKFGQRTRHSAKLSLLESFQVCQYGHIVLTRDTYGASFY